VDADLNKYKNVTIWCARFGVNFGQAALEAPVSIPVKVAEGNFRGVAHETKGMAAVYKLPDGKNVLRFSAFETSNGPDVHIYLVAANDAGRADRSLRRSMAAHPRQERKRQK
jgi:Electron transfer DM13